MHYYLNKYLGLLHFVQFYSVIPLHSEQVSLQQKFGAEFKFKCVGILQELH